MTPEGAKLQLIFGRRILVEMLLLLLWLLLKSRGFVGVVVAIGVWAGTGGRIVPLSCVSRLLIQSKRNVRCTIFRCAICFSTAQLANSATATE